MRVRGFSLIELMVVIGVIAIINIVMMPSFTSLQRSAKQLSAKSSARQIMVLLEQYYFMNQRYPDGDMVSISMIISELNQLGLISSDPINPYTGRSYSLADTSGQLLYSKQGSNAYRLVGYGEDNQSVVFEYP